MAARTAQIANPEPTSPRGATRPSVFPLWPRGDDDTDEGRLWLTWLVRLRWLAILAQVVTLSFVSRLLDSPTLYLPLLAVIAVLVVGNLRAVYELRTRRPVPQGGLLLQLGVDVVALTAFFTLAGGPHNPFVMLYLVHIAMGAVMLRAPLAAALTGLTLVSYGLVHLFHAPLHLERHSIPERVLIPVGHATSFTITTISVAIFVVGLARTLRWREGQLLEARDRTARTDRLRSVGTLAAGAAHELNTPLSTIGLRIRRIARRHTDPDTVSDLDTVRAQLERCKQIVDQLLVGAGDPSASDLARAPLGMLVHRGVHMWEKGSTIPVDFHDASGDLTVEVPQIAFTQGLVNLLENAREAQQEAGRFDPIEVRVVREGDVGVVLIRDHGCGLPTDKDRVGEPFFTTKVTGTGLGVFVARAIADGSGGGLGYTSEPGRGTEARWWFPPARRRSP